MAADEWPVTQDAFSESLDVLSVVARRHVDESIPEVAAQIAEVVGAALRQLDGFAFCLLYLEREYPITGRVNAFKRERYKLWLALEMQGIAVPVGERAERDVSEHPGRSQYFGSVRLDEAEFVTALGLARENNVICVASRGELTALAALDDDLVARAHQQAAHRHGPNALLRAVISDLPRGSLAMRAFGAFDDVEIAIDIVGEAKLIDELQAAVAKIAVQGRY